jgi:uncharacterized protein YbjT (DUF2867 family)
MKVIIFGASGMVGAGVLIECLEDSRIESVLVVGRNPCGIAHPKVRETFRKDFFDFSDMNSTLAGYHACFFTLGVTSVGKTEAEYYRLTHDVTIAAARVIAEVNPGLTFCYVTGEGADSTEKGRSMWARVKGKTENDLFKMNLKAFAFRPGYIQPMKGVRSKTAWVPSVLQRLRRALSADAAAAADARHVNGECWASDDSRRRERVGVARSRERGHQLARGRRVIWATAFSFRRTHRPCTCFDHRPASVSTGRTRRGRC